MLKILELGHSETLVVAFSNRYFFLKLALLFLALFSLLVGLTNVPDLCLICALIAQRVQEHQNLNIFIL
jgi:hypothetical protein